MCCTVASMPFLAASTKSGFLAVIIVFVAVIGHCLSRSVARGYFFRV